MNTRVLPCPMCGSEPRLVDMAGWEILCKCGLMMAVESPKKADVVAAWNKRASYSGETARDAMRYQLLRSYNPGLMLDMLTDRPTPNESWARELDGDLDAMAARRAR